MIVTKEGKGEGYFDPTLMVSHAINFRWLTNFN